MPLDSCKTQCKLDWYTAVDAAWQNYSQTLDFETLQAALAAANTALEACINGCKNSNPGGGA